MVTFARPDSVKTKDDAALFDKVALELINNDREMFDSLSAYEKRVVLDWIAESLAEGNTDNRLHDLLWELDFERKPVSIQTFLEDDYYMGRHGSELFDCWKQDLATLYSPGSPIVEWALTGAIGIGKTTAATLALAYKIYYLSCLRDPARYYGLLPGSLIVFGIYSITKRQVADSGYFKLKGLIDTSPYFRFDFPRSTKIDSKIDFTPTTGKSIQVLAGSSELHAIGLDLFSFCFSDRHHVWTEDGVEPIKSLMGNPKRVWTWTGYGYRLTDEALEVELTGHQPVVPIRLASGQTIEPTLTQQMLVRRQWEDRWVYARDLQPGDKLLAMPTGRGKLNDTVSKEFADADVQDMQQDVVLPDPAPEAAWSDGQGVPGPVLRGGVVRPSAEQAPTGAEGEVPGLQPLDAIPDADAPTGARPDGRAVCQGVSRFAPQGGGRGGCVLREGEGACQATARRPVLHGGSEARHREDAQAVHGRPGVSRPDGGEGAGDARRGPDAGPLVGQAEVQESARACVGGLLDSGGHSVDVRAQAGSELQGRTRQGPPVLSGLSGARPIGGVSAPVPSRGEPDAEAEGVLRGGDRDGGDAGVGPDADTVAPAVRREAGRVEVAFQPVPEGVYRTPSPCVHFPVMDEVVSVGEPTEAMDVYDVVNVPHTHCFLTGIDPDLDPVVAHNTMDEVNFMRAKQDKESGKMIGQAYDLYRHTEKRIKSRYMRPGGTVPGVMLLMSSKNGQTDFLEEKLKQDAGKGTILVSDYALWEAKPKDSFILPKFRVEIGDRVQQTRILKKDEKTREGAKIIEVPGEFLNDFVKDPDEALRDIAGQATRNSSPLIRDLKSIPDARREELQHPFSREEISLNLEDDTLLEDFYDLKLACRVKDSRWVPRINPGLPRYFHCDIGLTGDCAGIAMGHVSGLLRHERVNMDGTVSETVSPFIIMDFMLRIRPPIGSEIDLTKIVGFVKYLKRLYPVRQVTFDGFQSRYAIQTLRKLGVKSNTVSMDRGDEPYLMLRATMFERRLGVYQYDPFENEMLDLIRDINKRKVDHPDRAGKGGKGSKDVADAVCGVVWCAMNDDKSTMGVPVMDSDERLITNVVDPTDSTIRRDAQKVQRVVGEHVVDWEDLRRNVAR